MLYDVHRAFIWHNGITGRRNMLYSIGQLSGDSPVSESNPYTDSQYALSTWTLIKMLAKRILSNKGYDGLVRIRNRIRCFFRK